MIFEGMPNGFFKCVGVEALLRYNHYLHGVIYPPLVIRLAEEGEFLPALEEAVLRSALSDWNKVTERFGQDVRLSVNVTGPTVVTQRYLQFCRKLQQDDVLENVNLCLEITEQAAVAFTDDAIAILQSFRFLSRFYSSSSSTLLNVNLKPTIWFV